MSEKNAERVLRDAVHELAGAPHQSPGLAAIAMTRGRRIRRRRRVGAVAAAFVAVAAIAAPYVWLRPDPEAPAYPIAVAPGASSATALPAAGPAHPTGPSPSPPGPARPTVWDNWQSGPLVLPGGWVVIGATTSGSPVSNWTYDRTRRRYVDTSRHFTSVWTAPRGRLAAVHQESRSGETGLLDVPTGDVRWFQTGGQVLTPQWSPDGTRLLVTLADKGTGDLSFGVLTVADSSFRRYAVRSDRFECTDLCRFTWLPGGREVALPITDPGAPRSESAPHARRGLQLFSALDGTPTRFLPVRGNVAGPSAWSPDGRLVVVAGQQAAQLVAVDRGTVLQELPSDDVAWITDDRLLYLDRVLGSPNSIRPVAVLIDRRGTEIERAVLPEEFAGSTVQIAPS